MTREDLAPPKVTEEDIQERIMDEEKLGYLGSTHGTHSATCPCKGCQLKAAMAKLQGKWQSLK